MNPVGGYFLGNARIGVLLKFKAPQAAPPGDEIVLGGSPGPSITFYLYFMPFVIATSMDLLATAASDVTLPNATTAAVQLSRGQLRLEVIVKVFVIGST